MVRRQRYADPDQGVARNEPGQLLFIQIFGPGGPHREDHVADVGGAVVDEDLDVFRWFEAELAHHGSRFSDGAGAVFEALVPVGWAAEDGPRVAGTQGANYQVVHLWGVLDHDELDRAGGVYAELLCRGLRVGEEELFELGAHPGPGHEPRAVGWRAGLHVGDSVLYLRL